ncbi:MAG: signal peptide peptidase SppA [Proteobacteria bacterium]|nr:signal peptide peptidase SppA [Pseudomonadota bacterium]
MARSKIKTAFLVIFIIIILSFFISLAIGVSGRAFGEKIGVVEIEGVIADSKDIMEDIVRFKEDETIKGVILRINSPGGSVPPSQEIFEEVKKLRAKKKVYISMGTVCASGGYYIATAGEKIYAMPSTITGSIGVIMEQVVIEDLMKKVGLQPNTMKAGDFKDVGSPFRKMKVEERKYFQEILNTIHTQFINTVATQRKIPMDTAKKLSDGRIYLGQQAKDLKLIDQIGTFYDTVDDMKNTLNIKGKPVLVYGKRPFSLLKWLISSISQELISQQFSSPFKYIMTP